MALLPSRLAVAAHVPADPAAFAHQTIDKTLNYLKTKQQPDFSWQGKSDPPGISAIVLRAFIGDSKYDPDDPFLDKGFNKLISYQQANGGIYQDTLAAYNTAIAISSLAISKEQEYHAAVGKAVDFLKSIQWSDKIAGVADDQKPKDDKDVRWGGFGYGGAKGSRPDLSNTQMALDALRDAGVKPDDPAFQMALKFASRCQNFSETNDQAFAGDDGGFIYSPFNNGQSAAGEYTLNGRRMLRSYGSMTYAGLKSMIYAGLTHDDPRVKAAWDWISKNFTVDENPGMGASGPDSAQAGLYYYFYTMSRALSAYGQPVIIDPQGNKHDWRIALITKIATLQHADGSFQGQAKWMEGNPVLTSAYVALALEAARDDLKAHPAQ